MKSYIITIIGAALLSATALIIAPDKWRGYVRLITGLVIISCIVSPMLSLIHSDIFDGFDTSFETAAESGNIRRDIIRSELEKRINADIESRLKTEFGMNVRAECEIDITDDGTVEGVRLIRIYGGGLTDTARLRLCEVYGIKPQEVQDD